MFLQRSVKELVLTVVNVITLGGSHLLLDVGDAGVDEDVVQPAERIDVRGEPSGRISRGQSLG